jgi:hypothetical protein
MGLSDLFKPNHKASDPEVRLRFVERTSDQERLAEMAAHDSSVRVRKAAIARIDDDKLLESVALNGEYIDARIAAVQRIESQTTLARIIKLRRNYDLMAACFARITDKSILDMIANDKEYNLSARRIAIENYADEAYLTESIGSAADHAEKSPEEVDALVNKYGGDNLVRALSRFRGSQSAIKAMGQIMRSGSGASEQAAEQIAQGLVHANHSIREAAERELVTISDGQLVAVLLRLMDNPELEQPIKKVLANIDHPDARQFG